MNAWKRLDERLSAGKGRTLWQFVKFNLVSLTVTILQLLLANLLPLAFDRVVSPLPPLLRGIFRADALFPDGSKYVVNGVVTWGYVLPFLLANGLANIYGYFINMKTTFRGKGTRAGFAVYLAIPSHARSPRSARASCRRRCSSRSKNLYCSGRGRTTERKQHERKAL